MDKAELLKVVASLSPEEKAAIGIGPAPARAPVAAHKWNATADAVPDGDVARVVNACRAGIKHVADNPGRAEADGEAMQMLAEVAPALAAGVRESCHVRRQSYAWGLARVTSYMQSEGFAAKREAARRRVPPATEVPAVKGGGK